MSRPTPIIALPSAEQRQFAASLHALLEAADPPSAARRWAAGDLEPGLHLWRRLADTGVTALAIPPSCGGLGAGPLDVVVACEELGHHAVPGPVVETVAAVPALLASVPSGRAAGVLAELADGRRPATLAVPPAVPLAADADAAGVILLADPRDGSVRVAVPGPAQPSVDPTRQLHRLAATDLIGAGAAVQRAIEWGTLASAAQLLGLGRGLLEAAVRYAGQRHQFGRPVGSFQAVQHHLADVLIALEFARPLLYAAADALAADARSGDVSAPPDASAARDVSAAKVACADAADTAARTALQVHGAIGYTLECDVGLFLTKVRAVLPLWGTRAAHRLRILESLTMTTVTT